MGFQCPMCDHEATLREFYHCTNCNEEFVTGEQASGEGEIDRLRAEIEQSEARVRELHRRAQKAEGRIERVQHWVDTWEGAEPKSVAHQVMLDEIKHALANSRHEQ